MLASEPSQFVAVGLGTLGDQVATLPPSCPPPTLGAQSLLPQFLSDPITIVFMALSLGHRDIRKVTADFVVTSTILRPPRKQKGLKSGVGGSRGAPPVPQTSFTKHTCKDKTTKGFKMVTESIKPLGWPRMQEPSPGHSNPRPLRRT